VLQLAAILKIILFRVFIEVKINDYDGSRNNLFMYYSGRLKK
jgi:hypothetical protein